MPPVPVFSPSSDQTQSISNLFLWTLFIAMLIVILVSGLTIYAGIKFRHKRGDSSDEPRQVSGSLRLEVAWTVGPAILLIAIFIPTIMVMNETDPAAPKGNPPADINIIGHQYWWEYQLPKEGNLILANELHIPVGVNHYASITSADVNHDWWVPQLARKMDAIKGQLNHIYLKSNQTGAFLGHCAEYCGTQHAWMNISVYVDTPDDYAKWLQQQKTVPPTPTDPTLAHGQQVFLNNTCINCHAISGTTAQARVAPDLTHLGGRHTLGSGIIENTPANLQKWIYDPQEIKPGIRMPAYKQLPEQDLKDLTAYLESLK